ncbi:unnamed protein product [Gongylonema pulchrum]|uniref:Uncharacterized protein n=1 Tax=Gongylonema pulchrum TaxID=637853 RepID=A0A183EEI0_9BILA|nr:unnamed protein product [Gongylonema pulchrum]
MDTENASAMGVPSELIQAGEQAATPKKPVETARSNEDATAEVADGNTEELALDDSVIEEKANGVSGSNETETELEAAEGGVEQVAEWPTECSMSTDEPEETRSSQPEEAPAEVTLFPCFVIMRKLVKNSVHVLSYQRQTSIVPTRDMGEHESIEKCCIAADRV